MMRKHKKLGAVLKSLGFALDEKWNAVGGSQDLPRWEVSSMNGTLVVESETYIGLSVAGPVELVRHVRRGFEARY
jgi:hypothetical protein